MRHGGGFGSPLVSQGESMEIVVTNVCHFRGVPRAVGDVLLVTSSEARQLVSSGVAEELKTEKKKPKNRKVKKVAER